MQRCCILGGGGFIGTNLARHLALQGHEVRIFGNRPRFDSALEHCKQYDGDFGDLGTLSQAVDGCDVVYHLIGHTTLTAIEAAKAEDIDRYLKNTLRLLDLAVEGRFGRLVFTSSGGTVYGIPSTVPLHEDSPQWPITSYGVGNLSTERYLHVYHHQHGVDYRVARLSNPYGPYQLADKGQGVIAKLLECSLRGMAFPLMGDGSVVRDYIAVTDVADALQRLAVYPGEHRIFNIGSGVGHTLNEIIQLIEQETGHPIAIQNLPARTVDAPVNILNIERVCTELDWQPRTTLADGLHQAARWMRQHLEADQSERAGSHPAQPFTEALG